jgi:DNA-binding response OmpR family regulator
MVVNENQEARREIAASLNGEGHRIVELSAAREALEAARVHPPQLVILDLYFRDLSGLVLCGMLREEPGLGRVPLLVVSQRASEVDRILAFEFGADDFLPEPFYPRELAARVRALLRSGPHRAGAPEPNSNRSLTVDLGGGRVEVDGRHVDLTRKELMILAELVSPAGKVVRRRELIERLWGPGAAVNGRAIDAHIKNIRRKLGTSRTQVETVRGVGYRIAESD